jgi:hypothetical protein
MSFKMRRVDHQPLRLARVASQFGKSLVEHAKAAPAHKSVIDRLVRTVLARSIAPAQTVPDDMDDPADHPSVIHSRNPVRQRKILLDPAHLRLREQKQTSHDDASSRRQRIKRSPDPQEL